MDDRRPLFERALLALGIALVMLAPLLDVPLPIAFSVLALSVVVNLAHHWGGAGGGSRPLR